MTFRFPLGPFAPADVESFALFRALHFPYGDDVAAGLRDRATATFEKIQLQVKVWESVGLVGFESNNIHDSNFVWMWFHTPLNAWPPIDMATLTKMLVSAYNDHLAITWEYPAAGEPSVVLKFEMSDMFYGG